MSEAAHLIKDGNVCGIPILMRGDLERAYKIYGEHPEYIQEQLVKKRVGRVRVAYLHKPYLKSRACMQM
jgi:hypothetical protein